mmetsp:Transcript_46623/g.117424  ORF Transcript_46623/g.117424 Transcript_46623/m.117424 type:complete len:283 (+) Transcript_46623:1703-2551(+)
MQAVRVPRSSRGGWEGSSNPPVSKIMRCKRGSALHTPLASVLLAIRLQCAFLEGVELLKCTGENICRHRVLQADKQSLHLHERFRLAQVFVEETLRNNFKQLPDALWSVLHNHVGIGFHKVDELLVHKLALNVILLDGKLVHPHGQDHVDIQAAAVELAQLARSRNCVLCGVHVLVGARVGVHDALGDCFQRGIHVRRDGGAPKLATQAHAKHGRLSDLGVAVRATAQHFLEEHGKELHGVVLAKLHQVVEYAQSHVLLHGVAWGEQHLSQERQQLVHVVEH